jgi:phytoene dehydrogenase-like protein
VLERHFKLGGFTHTFERPGRRSWDVGLHYVGEMAQGSMGRQLFDFVTGGGVDWHKMPSPFEKFIYPDFTFDVPDDQTAYQEALVSRFSDERSAIGQYFTDVRAARKWFDTSVFARSSPKVLGSFISLGNRGSEKLALSTTGEYLERHFRSQQLKAVLASQWGCYGLPPGESAFVIHALIVCHYLRGGYYPVGGSGTIAQSIAPIIEAYGGQCPLNHTVTEIIVREGRAIGVKVTAKKGSKTEEIEYYAPVVVSDAGAYTTFCRLLPESIEIPFRAELERTAAGCGFVSLYIGFKEDPARLGFRGENHWIYTGYDHNAMFSRRNAVLEGEPVCCFLSFPSLRDPKATAHTAQIIAPLDYARVEPWKDRPWLKRGEEYQILKGRIAEGVLRFVDDRYPGFKALVDYCEVATPLTVESFTGHLGGSIYGVPATPDRFRRPWLSVTTPVKNLYLTGADVASPGIVGAMMGGVATAARLQGSLGFFRIISAAKRFAAKRNLS